MKKILLLATAVLFLFATTAMADSIKGKAGITLRGGASYIFNSEWTDEAITLFDGNVTKDIKPEIGWAGGGGIMYGIADNLTVNFDVIYLQADLKATSDGIEAKMCTGKTIDFALGAQWRFMPKSRFVPYVEAGFDILMNELDPYNPSAGESVKVASTYGGHLSVGADFFITPNIALNAEIRGLYSTKGDVTLNLGELAPGINESVLGAEYNPSNISGFVGIRFFFP